MGERLTRKDIVKRVGLSTAIAFGFASEYDVINETTITNVVSSTAQQGAKAIRVADTLINNFPVEALIHELPKDIKEYEISDPVAETILLANNYTDILPSLIDDFNNRNYCEITPEEEVLKTKKQLEAEIKFSSKEFSEERKHDRALKLAEKYELTLADERPYYELIDNADSFELVLGYLNHYGSNHSLHFSIPNNKEISDFPITYDVLNSESYSLEDFKLSSKELISDLYYIPTELTNFSSIRDIKIVDKIHYSNFIESYARQNVFVKDENQKQIKLSPGGIINPATRNTYISVNDISSLNLSKRVIHEISHGIIFNYCGVFDSIEDKEYGRLNPEDFKYKDIESFNLFKDITSSEYGYNAVYEDQAYVMNDYIFTNNEIPMNALSPTERKKVTLSFARLNQIAPNFSNYWLTKDKL